MKNIKFIAVVLLAAFLLAQGLVRTHFTQGPVCSPALTETGAGSHPMYESTGYGFPRAVIAVVTNTCVDPPVTSLQVQPIGSALSALILAGLAYPFWKRKA